ncbi:RNA polymerase sigma factor [Gabonibacter chumensis]|uniref:RNA polymerase sigma factor n=1 Tax=Gabonibacter chumensis TaxID=2972474 RepID=UPI00257476FA|nr:sigma-70 family RNA polymerase sigma factor [Gabonibacter chumensis]MCR9011871.1 sigma-70 family RNA polymerase sigma factor [Gabonibacter chumensis]
MLHFHDQRGIKLLFETYYKSLVSWANIFLNDLGIAEDIVQEFFVMLWNEEMCRKLKPETLPSFLRVAVRNRCYNRLIKRDVFTRFVSVERVQYMFEEYDDSKDMMIAKVMDEIALLPPRSQEILSSVFVEGMKYREVAERYGISVSTVKTLLGTSVRRLRERMGRDGFHDFLLIYCKWPCKTPV